VVLPGEFISLLLKTPEQEMSNPIGAVMPLLWKHEKQRMLFLSTGMSPVSSSGLSVPPLRLEDRSARPLILEGSHTLAPANRRYRRGR